MDLMVDKAICQELEVRGANAYEKNYNFASKLTSQVSSFSISIAAGASNVTTITISPLDAAGNVLTGVRTFLIWVSDVSTGIGVAATFIPDSITATTGTVLKVLTAAKILICQTNASGILVLSLTDTAKAAGYIAIENPVTSTISVGTITATTSYGA